MKFFKSCCIGLLSLCISQYINAKEIEITLTNALKQNLVTITAVGSGASYNENGLTLRIDNKGKKAMNISVEPGLLFSSNDTTYQDLLIAGDLQIQLPAAGYKNMSLQSYCAKSYALGPVKDNKFTFQKQADSNIIKTLAYVKSHHINTELAQKAIWVWTNHKDLHTVYDPGDDVASKNLIMYLAMLAGKGLPGYYSYFDLNHDFNNTPIIAEKPLRIYATFKWTLKENKELTLAVYDERGNVIQKMFEHQTFKVGGYELNAKFESADVPSGKYVIRLSSASDIIKETIVSVD